MEFGFWDVIQIIGALAFFVYGMKMMSDGIQRAAGSQLRNILRSMTKNRFLGVGTGFLNHCTSTVFIRYHCNDCIFCKCWTIDTC